MEATKCYYHPDRDAIGICAICGRPLCEECGVEIEGEFYHKKCLEQKLKGGEKKLPGIAAFLSILFPGLGTVYAGKTLKGIAYMLIFAGTIYSIAAGGPATFLGLFLAGFYLFAIVDAYNDAKKAQGEIEVSQPPAPAEADKLIRSGIFWLLVGILLQLITLDVLDLSELIRFWPVILIGFGLYLIIRYFQERRLSHEERQ